MMMIRLFRARFARKDHAVHHCSINSCILCYAIVVPGRESAFRAGFWPDCYRENAEIGRPECRFRFFPGSSPAKIRPGRPIYGPEALLPNYRNYRLVTHFKLLIVGPDQKWP
jgi:hypothetical protein